MRHRHASPKYYYHKKQTAGGHDEISESGDPQISDDGSVACSDDADGRCNSVSGDRDDLLSTVHRHFMSGQDIATLEVSDDCDTSCSSSRPSACDHEVPGKVINFITDTVKFLTVQVQINNKLATAIIDTGAQASLISSQLVDKLNLPIYSDTESLKVIGHSHFETVGSVKVDSCIGDIQMEQSKFRIFPKIVNENISLLLGVDFLKLNRLEVCAGKRMLIKHFEDGSAAKIYIDKVGAPANVMFSNIMCFAARDIKIDKGQVQRVPINYCIPSKSPNQLLLYDDAGIDCKLSGRVHGLTGIASEETKYILMSSTETPVTVKKGQPLGSLSSVFQLTEDMLDVDGVSPCDENVFNLPLPELSVGQQAEVISILKRYKSVFCTGDLDIGHANITDHHIELTDETPIYQQPR